MANQLSLAQQLSLPAGWQTGVPANGTVIDLNAVIDYEREKRIRYSVALSGAYVQHVRGSNVGEVLNLAAALGTSTYQAGQFWGNTGPVRGYIINNGSTGYGMSICPGADSLHWLLVLFSGIATELAAGAYPAGLIADQDIVVEFTGVNWQ